MKRLLCFLLITLCIPTFVCAETLAAIYESTMSTDIYTTPDSELKICIDHIPSSDDMVWDIAILPIQSEELQQYLDLSLAGDLTSSSALACLLPDMPPQIASKVSRNDSLYALPISLTLQNTFLLTTSETLNNYSIEASTIPTTIEDFFCLASEWYASGKLDNVQLLQQYNSPEMIVYFALQQYTIATLNAGASLEGNIPLLQQLLESSLNLAELMSEHNAFSASATLFVMAAPDTDSSSPSLETNNKFRLEDAELLGHPFLIPLRLHSDDPPLRYYTGLVALVNSNSSNLSSAISLLEAEVSMFSPLTIKYLNTSTSIPNVAVESETLNKLGESGALYTLASQLIDNKITINECIDLLLDR